MIMLHLPKYAWMLTNGKGLFFLFVDENDILIGLHICPERTDDTPRLFIYENSQLSEVIGKLSKKGIILPAHDFRINWNKTRNEIGVVARQSNERAFGPGYSEVSWKSR